MSNALGERLRGTRKRQGVSIKTLADRMGVAPNTLAGYERGERLPDPEFLGRFAYYTDANVIDLLTKRLEVSEVAEVRQVVDPAFGSGGFLLHALASSDGTPSTGDRSTGEMGEFVLLPRYEVRAGAGGGQVVHSEQIVDHLAFKRDWVLHRLRRDPADLILLEASGDSMADKIRHGDLLLVDTGVDRVHDHAIYALNIGGELMVKYVQRLIAGGCQIFSENPKYPPETLTDQKLNELRVVGQVIWAGGVL